MKRLLLSVVLAGVPVAAASSQEAPASTRGSAVPRTAGIRLVNRHSLELTVEIRVATDRGCDGPMIITARVAPNTTTQFHSSKAVCIRRERVTESGARVKSDWERKEPQVAATPEVIL